MKLYPEELTDFKYYGKYLYDPCRSKGTKLCSFCIFILHELHLIEYTHLFRNNIQYVITDKVIDYYRKNI